MAVCALVVATLGVGLVAEVWVSQSSAGPSIASDGQVAGDLAGATAANPTIPDTAPLAPVTAVETRYLQRRDEMAEAGQARTAEHVRKFNEAKQRALAREAARKAKQLAKKLAKERATAPFELTLGSFNVLGSQHTAPGGDRRNFPPASVRSVAAVNLMGKHGVDIVGTQELQNDQLAALQSRTGFSAYPGLQWGSKETDNSILYDDDRFTFVSGSQFTIPFMGRPRPQPILRLKEATTGREFYVVNTHPSAGDGRYLTERRQGQATLVGVVNELKESGLPVFVTGDMNDRQEFYCRVVPVAGLIASNGGSYSGGCRPPSGSIAVDWVVGAGDLSWSGYWRDTSPVTTRMSDHFFISATAHVG